MKLFTFLIGAALLGPAGLAFAEGGPNQYESPCFSVTIQNKPVNNSSIQQDCDRNFSRTVQAGAQNSAVTVQTGQINSNKVRQYWYDRMEYLSRIRGE